MTSAAAPIILDAGPKGFARGLGEDLQRVTERLNAGDLLHLDSTHPMLDAALLKWCHAKGNALVEKTPLPGGGTRYVVRLGGAAEVAADASEGAADRLWLYTNFHCNLACDYCCVRSSPRAAPARLPLPRVRELASEARALGFRRILLTGGEPFLLPDLDEIARACVEQLPTTLLTNAMLWDGPRRALLERMPREGLTLQVSLDSPEPSVHDAHRGAGSWERARNGIALARSLGFRVRVAATTHTREQAVAMRSFLTSEGVPTADQLVRPVALRGEAREGLPLQRSELEPELTITASGAYWHPVGATDADFLVAREVGPLSDLVARVRAMREEDGAASRVAAVFHCT